MKYISILFSIFVSMMLSFSSYGMLGTVNIDSWQMSYRDSKIQNLPQYYSLGSSSYQKIDLQRPYPNQYWNLLNNNNSPRKLMEIQYSLEYCITSESTYDSYGSWVNIHSIDDKRLPKILLKIYKLNENDNSIETKLIDSLANLKFNFIDHGFANSLYLYFEFEASNTSFDTLAKVLSLFVDRGDLTQEKREEFLRHVQKNNNYWD